MCVAENEILPESRSNSPAAPPVSNRAVSTAFSVFPAFAMASAPATAVSAAAAASASDSWVRAAASELSTIKGPAETVRPGEAPTSSLTQYIVFADNKRVKIEHVMSANDVDGSRVICLRGHTKPGEVPELNLLPGLVPALQSPAASRAVLALPLARTEPVVARRGFTCFCIPLTSYDGSPLKNLTCTWDRDGRPSSFEWQTIYNMFSSKMFSMRKFSSFGIELHVGPMLLYVPNHGQTVRHGEEDVLMRRLAGKVIAIDCKEGHPTVWGHGRLSRMNVLRNECLLCNVTFEVFKDNTDCMENRCEGYLVAINTRDDACRKYAFKPKDMMQWGYSSTFAYLMRLAGEGRMPSQMSMPKPTPPALALQTARFCVYGCIDHTTCGHDATAITISGSGAKRPNTDSNTSTASTRASSASNSPISSDVESLISSGDGNEAAQMHRHARARVREISPDEASSSSRAYE